MPKPHNSPPHRSKSLFMDAICQVLPPAFSPHLMRRSAASSATALRAGTRHAAAAATTAVALPQGGAVTLLGHETLLGHQPVYHHHRRIFGLCTRSDKTAAHLLSRTTFGESFLEDKHAHKARIDPSFSCARTSKHKKHRACTGESDNAHPFTLTDTRTSISTGAGRGRGRGRLGKDTLAAITLIPAARMRSGGGGGDKQPQTARGRKQRRMGGAGMNLERRRPAHTI